MVYLNNNMVRILKFVRSCPGGRVSKLSKGLNITGSTCYDRVGLLLSDGFLVRDDYLLFLSTKGELLLKVLEDDIQSFLEGDMYER